MVVEHVQNLLSVPVEMEKLPKEKRKKRKKSSKLLALLALRLVERRKRLLFARQHLTL